VHKLLSGVCGFALTVALGMASLPVVADQAGDARLEELQKKLDQSLKLIEALTARVKDLEARQSGGSVAAAAATPAAPAANPQEQRLDSVEEKVAQIESANATRQHDDTGLPIHGFADVNLGNHNLYFPYFHGLNVGSLDFYLTPKLGDRVVSLTELIFETGPDGMVGTDLERFQIGYQFSDRATVWAGRFHTPYGYVNTALHHGVWLADALRRPKFVNFEDKGGNLPAHTVGLWITGSERLGEGKVLYDFYAGNGQKIIGGIVDMQNGGTDHGAVIAGSRLSYQFAGAADGLTAGVNGFIDKVNSDHTLNDMVVTTRLDMVGAYAAYDTDDWEHIAEVYFFHDQNPTISPSYHNSHAWFAQLAYRAHWGLPYVRYERASFDQADLYFSDQTFGASYYRAALGIRFDINARSALKFELAHTRNTDERLATDYRPGDITIGIPVEYNEYLAQYAVRF
jgi:hypothetical protein